MKLQQLLSFVRRGVDDYNMIEEGDKIAVGISGGKDSLCLLYAMKGLQRFYPKKFDLVAVSVNLGFEGMDFTPVQKLCEELEVPYYLVPSEISELRSTYGTNLYRETGDIYQVADVLGHRDVNMTKKYYAAMADENRRRAAKAVKLREP